MREVFPGARRIGVMLAILVGIAAIFFLAPWQSWLEGRLKNFLEARGLSNVHLTVAGLDLNGLVLKDVAIGKTAPLHLDRIELALSPKDLLNGELQSLKISGLTLDIKQEKDGWNVSGIDHASQNSKPLTLPVTGAALPLPFNAVELENSHLHILSAGWQAEIPLRLDLQRQPSPHLSYEAESLALTGPAMRIATGKADLQAELEEGKSQWSGEWHIADIKMTGTGADIPLLQGNGTVTAKEEQLMVEGQFASADHAWQSSFDLDYFLNAPNKSRLRIRKTELPWQGGVLAVDDAAIPFGERHELNLDLAVKHVSLAALLRQLTGKDTSATGVISGILPLTLGADGALAVRTGKLAAEEPGVIAMPPTAIPGDNPQIALTRDILKNFHYSVLSIEIDQQPDNKLSVMMKLEGSNPDIEAGRVVKLNVHLTGDMLDFVRQNLMILQDPQKLIQQVPDAKH